MNKVVAYLLLIQFSFGACIPKTDFSQLLLLDDLMQHFEIHQLEAAQTNTTISFSHFLYIHFISGDEHEHENGNNHEQLPLQQFSSVMDCCLVMQVAFKSSIIIFSSTELPIFKDNNTQIIISDIFHPPSLA